MKPKKKTPVVPFEESKPKLQWRCWEEDDDEGGETTIAFSEAALFSDPHKAALGACAQWNEAGRYAHEYPEAIKVYVRDLIDAGNTLFLVTVLPETDVRFESVCAERVEASNATQSDHDRFKDALGHIAGGNISPSIDFARYVLDGLDVAAAHRKATSSRSGS